MITSFGAHIAGSATSWLVSASATTTVPTSGTGSGVNVTAQCDFYNGLAPSVNKITGEFVGLASLGPIIIVAILALLVFFAASRRQAGNLARAAIMIFFVLILLGAAPLILNAVTPTSC